MAELGCDPSNVTPVSIPDPLSVCISYFFSLHMGSVWLLGLGEAAHPPCFLLFLLWVNFRCLRNRAQVEGLGPASALVQANWVISSQLLGWQVTQDFWGGRWLTWEPAAPLHRRPRDKKPVAL